MSHSAEGNGSSSSGEGEGVLHIYVKMRVFIIWFFWYFTMESLYSSRVQLSPGGVARLQSLYVTLTRKCLYSVVSCNPWCTLGCLVSYFSIVYFSCVPGGREGEERKIYNNNKISFTIPQIFKHDSFTLRVRRELISDFCCAMTNHDKPTSFCAIWYF